MKKLIVVLVIILSAVLLLGIKYQRDNLYEANEIEKANVDMMTEFSSNNDEQEEEVEQVTAQSDDEEENSPPEIIIAYPSTFKDGATVETDKVQLNFSDDSKVIKATMNNQKVSLEEIRITTEGTYKIEIQDDTNNKTSLTFTLEHP